MSYSDKRRHPRLPVLVECRIDGVSGRAQIRMTDLSPVGCYVDTSVAFSPGTLVTLYATLGDSEVALSGRVIPMPQGGTGFGIEFTDLDASVREALDSYIRKVST